MSAELETPYWRVGIKRHGEQEIHPFMIFNNVRDADKLLNQLVDLNLVEEAILTKVTMVVRKKKQ